MQVLAQEQILVPLQVWVLVQELAQEQILVLVQEQVLVQAWVLVTLLVLVMPPVQVQEQVLVQVLVLPSPALVLLSQIRLVLTRKLLLLLHWWILCGCLGVLGKDREQVVVDFVIDQLALEPRIAWRTISKHLTTWK